jgi:hypothetical protein
VGLFLPVINIECSRLEGPKFGCGPDGATVDQLRADIAPVMDKAAQLKADVDGVRVDTALNPKRSAYRTYSPGFSFSLPPDDMLTAIGEGPFQPGNYSPAVGDGVYILVAPLASGQHTIHVHGAIPSSKFVLDVTYHLAVA